jgi:hypothetical protein
MREIFVESELREFPCPGGFAGTAGETSVGEPVQGGRPRVKPLFMHRLLAPEDLTQETLFVYRNWKSRRCYPDPSRSQSPLWWVVDGEAEHFVLVDGERRRASLSQIPTEPLFELTHEATLSLPVPTEGNAVSLFAPPAAAETSPDSITGDAAAANAQPVLWEADGEFGDREVAPPAAADAEVAALSAAEDPRPAEAACSDLSFPQQTQVVVSVAVQTEAAAGGAERGATNAASAVRRDDPFKRSLDAVLAELTAPVPVDPERQTRVAVRVIASAAGTATDGPVPLPSRPELVSEDFLARLEVHRPALIPIEPARGTTPSRLPGRAFALLAGVLVLFFSLALLLFR